MPTIFLSSTIYDLNDLRSAMKYWLEEQGFIVYASESPEFPYPLDRDAVAAALAPIDSADYYIVLVGGRRGQVVENEGISVTRAEFRHARETRRKTGRPQMLHLVRREISEARRTARPPGVTEEDWPAITSFLDEIATESERGDPNLLREFDSFRDVSDILRSTLRITGPLTRRALEASLLWELKANTRQLLGRTKGVLRPNALSFPNDIRLPPQVEASFEVEAPEAFWMLMFRMSLRQGLGQSALVESINSGSFLEWDVVTNSYVVGPLQQGLLELRRQIQSLDGLVGSISSSETITADTTELADAARARRPARVTAFTGRMLYGAWSATMNVLQLSRSLHQSISGPGQALRLPDLIPPYAQDEASRMSAEEVSEQDAGQWLESASWRLPPDGGSST